MPPPLDTNFDLWYSLDLGIPYQSRVSSSSSRKHLKLRGASFYDNMPSKMTSSTLASRRLATTEHLAFSMKKMLAFSSLSDS